MGYYYYIETLLGRKYTRYSLEQMDKGIYGQADSATSIPLLIKN